MSKTTTVPEFILTANQQDHDRLCYEAHRIYRNRINELSETLETVQQIAPEAYAWFVERYDGNRHDQDAKTFFNALRITLNCYPREQWFDKAYAYVQQSIDASKKTFDT